MGRNKRAAEEVEVEYGPSACDECGLEFSEEAECAPAEEDERMCTHCWYAKELEAEYLTLEGHTDEME